MRAGPPPRSGYWTTTEKWGTELPSDESLRTYLKRDKLFNDEAVGSVIKDYKDTLEYASLSNSDKLPDGDTDRAPVVVPHVGVKVQGQQLPIGDVEPVRIALEGGGIGRVIFSGSVPTPDDIEALIDVLKIQQRQMKKTASNKETAN